MPRRQRMLLPAISALVAVLALAPPAARLVAQGAARPQVGVSENEKLIRGFIKAWSRLDAAELASYFAEDGCYINIPTQPVCGRANIEKMIKGFVSTWTETDWEVKTLIAAGDVVVAERVDKTRTTKGNVDLPCVGIFELRDGRIKAWRDYFDLATFRNAMKG